MLSLAEDPEVPFRRLCGPLGLAAGVVPWGASILGTSLLSQLSTLGAPSLALAADVPKGRERGGLGRRHPAARLAWGCHQAVGWRRAICGPTVAAAVVGSRGACSVHWALLAHWAGGRARELCGWWLARRGRGSGLCEEGTVQWLWCEVRS